MSIKTASDAVEVQDLRQCLRLGTSYRPWDIQSTRSHILHSKCSKSEEICAETPCDFCIYSKSLDLRHLPDMVFPQNTLSLTHETGAKIQFNALDALKRVATGKINLQLPIAVPWKESRADCEEYLKEKIKPFDWTFTTDYMGTTKGLLIEETDERIDFDTLNKPEFIQFYKDLTLFEDEVHDRGTASLSVKIRVMEKSFFILLRYFLRIDHSIIRINDTRIYHKFENQYLLREYTCRESKIRDLHVPPSLLIDPTLIASQVPIQQCYYHKLTILPKSEIDSASSTSLNNDQTVITTSTTTTTTTTTAENNAVEPTETNSGENNTKHDDNASNLNT